MASTFSERPDSPLIVKCLFDKSMRRITFASAATCRLETLRARIEDCFSLSASTFFIAYTDDDGEETSIRSEADLTEAIHYFDTGFGDDDFSVQPSSFSTFPSDQPLPLHARGKVTLRVQVVVEYDGPSLSDVDTASVRSLEDSLYLEGEERSVADSSSVWRSETSRSSASRSQGGYATQRPLREVEPRTDLQRSREDPYDDDFSSERDEWARPQASRRTSRFAESSGQISRDDPGRSRQSLALEEDASRRRISRLSRRSEDARGMSLGTRRDSAVEKALARQLADLSPGWQAGPSGQAAGSRGPPSILTSSELGARWLREQNERAKRRTGPSSSSSRSTGRGTSMSGEDAVSDDEASIYEEGRGDLALVKDRRGKWYYSYQTSDLASEVDSAGDFGEEPDCSGLPDAPHRNGKARADWSTGSRSPSSRSISSESDRTSIPDELEQDVSDEPAAPPFFAPDCSACGLRLDYMRYACAICGEGHMWQEGQQEKHIVLEAHLNGIGSSDGASSGNAEWGQINNDTKSLPSSASSATAEQPDTRGNEDAHSSGSDASVEVLRTPQASPPTTPVKLTDTPNFGGVPNGAKAPHKAAHGYELCAGCIEIQGIAHARAMGAVDLELLQEGAFARDSDTAPAAGFARKLGAMRHTFRELIWSSKGWKEIEYNDECRCSICNLETYQNRFKCVSCANFNLCRSCHQNAQEIHPAHCFLSVPDQPKRLANGAGRGKKTGNGQVPKLLKHPGAFCHNCMQDIVGPRFHCAVCPSWDLCIQCEGLATPNASGAAAMHTPDHIMMKIPLPLASSEVEFVSRRARDRWTQRDYSAVSTESGTASPPPMTDRSPSPTNETVYGGGVARQIAPRNNAAVAVRDSLDHGVQCRGCNEWIMGRRYQCANCPSDPVPYSLCSLCELRSYKIHDPMHVFVKFDRPVHFPLQSPGRILPILYKTPVGQVRSTAPLDPRDPTAYLKCVTHTSTICDIHVGPIQGVWLRCAQCAVSFDICQECETIADHDPTHVFVVFKSEVDMPVFRAVANLSATHSRPLIHQHVYL